MNLATIEGVRAMAAGDTETVEEFPFIARFSGETLAVNNPAMASAFDFVRKAGGGQIYFRKCFPASTGSAAVPAASECWSSRFSVPLETS
jgi:hypothetical protein